MSLSCDMAPRVRRALGPDQITSGIPIAATVGVIDNRRWCWHSSTALLTSSTMSAWSATTTKSARVIIVTSGTRNLPTPSLRRRHFSQPSSAISRGGSVKTVTLEVREAGESMADFARAWRTGKPERSARISFATPELLWKVLTAKRWELLKALCGAGPVSIREAARRVNRDVKSVHGDVTALLSAGVLDRAEGGGIVFPYDAVKVEFLLRAA